MKAEGNGLPQLRCTFIHSASKMATCPYTENSSSHFLRGRLIPAGTTRLDHIELKRL